MPYEQKGAEWGNDDMIQNLQQNLRCSPNFEIYSTCKASIQDKNAVFVFFCFVEFF